VNAEYREGQRYTGGRQHQPHSGADNPAGQRQGPVNIYTEALASGAVVALNPETGKAEWKFEMHDVNGSGILTTASDLLFVGGREVISSPQCPHWRAALEAKPRRGNHRRPDDLSGRWQAVR